MLGKVILLSNEKKSDTQTVANCKLNEIIKGIKYFAFSQKQAQQLR